METLLMEHHKKYFNQAHSTLFASADIESIDTDQYNKEFLEERQHKPTDPPKIATELTLLDV
eukprot:6828638-Ditylum_brightwellii.AAC.1